MPIETNPSNLSIEEWANKFPIDELGDFEDLAKIMPYVKYIIGGWKFIKNLRAKVFLKSLGKIIGDQSEEEKEKFRKILQSKEGIEILTEYFDDIMRTSSETAIAALAILYSETDNPDYPREFKLATSMALTGITEISISIFIELSKTKKFIPGEIGEEVPYPIVVVDKDFLSTLTPETTHFLADPTSRIAFVNDLKQRGLFMPDYASARWGSEGPDITFGISETTIKISNLLERARELLPNPKKED